MIYVRKHLYLYTYIYSFCTAYYGTQMEWEGSERGQRGREKAKQKIFIFGERVWRNMASSMHITWKARCKRKIMKISIEMTVENRKMTYWKKCGIKNHNFQQQRTKSVNKRKIAHRKWCGIKNYNFQHEKWTICYNYLFTLTSLAKLRSQKCGKEKESDLKQSRLNTVKKLRAVCLTSPWNATAAIHSCMIRMSPSKGCAVMPSYSYLLLTRLTGAWALKNI